MWRPNRIYPCLYPLRLWQRMAVLWPIRVWAYGMSWAATQVQIPGAFRNAVFFSTPWRLCGRAMEERVDVRAVPRYDQSTFYGRVRAMFELTDMRTLLTTAEQVGCVGRGPLGLLCSPRAHPLTLHVAPVVADRVPPGAGAV